MTIIGDLRDCSWKGSVFPWTGERIYSFSHEQARHRYIFRDNKLIESIGLNNPSFTYDIPFYESIRQHGFKNLFTKVYPKFLEACKDRGAGILIDSVHDEVRCKCVSLREVLSVDVTDGVRVAAEFVFAPESEEDSSSNFSKIAKTIPQFQAATVEFGAKQVELTDEQKAQIRALQEEQKGPQVAVLDLGRAAAGSVQQVKDKTIATLGSYSAQLERTQEDIEQAQDPQLEDVRRESSRLIRASRELTETLRPRTPQETVRTANTMTRVALATFYKVTVDFLLAHNPQLANQYIVPPETEIYLPKKDG